MRSAQTRFANKTAYALRFAIAPRPNRQMIHAGKHMPPPPDCKVQKAFSLFHISLLPKPETSFPAESRTHSGGASSPAGRTLSLPRAESSSFTFFDCSARIFAPAMNLNDLVLLGENALRLPMPTFRLEFPFIRYCQKNTRQKNTDSDKLGRRHVKCYQWFHSSYILCDYRSS